MHRRQALAMLHDAAMTEKLFGAGRALRQPRRRLHARAKAGFRYGDAAPMAMIELVDRDPEAKGQDSGPTRTPRRSRRKPPKRDRQARRSDRRGAATEAALCVSAPMRFGRRPIGLR